ncbi:MULTISPECIES: SepM family pheromone-processing serine protease [Pontibacillus]|uniref:endopeptidase La n=1 Tax=Pontibacillus chungwhensis TaxID=265426 RepID=A0ABY8V1N9_9BACI|nr:MULTISPECIES: SepM family pheromone-processing serine protease [Pontibacillus]MCD5322572.1 PDZ domain-containing protein [Pontibacillus sp. HN14]WIF99857.1 SepM family pheromone-processing serine protease [Pontibacillus chungwhensis]
MKQNKRYFIVFAIVVVLAFFLAQYRLPYYIYQPGSADDLNPIVQVEGAYDSEGEMHLVTVSGGPATPIRYVIAKILPYHQVYDIEDIFPEGVDQEEYHHAQIQVMASSQEAAQVVAYRAAGKDVTIKSDGVIVMRVEDGMPAEGKLEVGDRITEVNGTPIKESEGLIELISPLEVGDSVEVTFVRSGKEMTKTVSLGKHPEENRAIMGIGLATKRSVEVDPPVKFKSGEIGGPSAGLMFSLEMYDQLTENDITKGYQVAGTGEISIEGKVGRIGGIDKKVVASDDEGIEIFFAPNEGGKEGSNYEVAKKTAEDIGTDMKIVPVDTFEDALEYLKDLEPKGK